MSEQSDASLSPQYLSVKNGQLEYVRFGKGTSIVLITGYSGDITVWDTKMLKRLVQQHEIIIFNNRNVGGSKINSDSYTNVDLANDTHELVKGLKLDKPAILGYSMGGEIAQKYATIYPNDMSKLILISTFIAGPRATPFTPDVENKLFHLSRNLFVRLYGFVQLLFPEGSRFKGAKELIWYRFIPSGYPFAYYPSDSTLRKQQQLLLDWFQDENTEKNVEALSLPVLIISGKKDIVVLPQNSVTLNASIHHSTLIQWDNGGHGLLFQDPEEIADTINKFLA